MNSSEIGRLNKIREHLDGIATAPQTLWGELWEVADEARRLHNDCRERVRGELIGGKAETQSEIPVTPQEDEWWDEHGDELDNIPSDCN